MLRQTRLSMAVLMLVWLVAAPGAGGRVQGGIVDPSGWRRILPSRHKTARTFA